MEELINLYGKEDIANRLGLESSVLDEWEKAGLLYPAGKYDKNTPYYNEENITQGKKLKSLMDLGYGLLEIKQIKAKIGLPTGSDAKGAIKGKLMTVGEIAEKIGISTRTLKYWEEKSLIKPDARSEGGFRLYRESFVEICLRIRELQLFGYSVEELKNMNLLLLPDERLQEEILSYREEERGEKLDNLLEQQKILIEKMKELRLAMKRWEGIAKKQVKLASRLKAKLKK